VQSFIIISASDSPTVQLNSVLLPQRNTEGSCLKQFVICLLRTTNDATYCCQRRVSPTCHSPVQLCVEHLVVTSLTTCDKAKYWSRITIFCLPHLHLKPR